MYWLVTATIVLGLSGGGCLSLITVMVSDITTLRKCPKFLAMDAFAWALDTNIGVGIIYTCISASSKWLTALASQVSVGGAIGEYTSYRWACWLYIAFCILS